MAFSRFLSTLLVSSLFLASACKRSAGDQLSNGGAKRARKNPFEVNIVDDGSVLPTYDETFQQSLGPLLYAPGRVTRSQRGQVGMNNASVVSAPAPAEELPEKPTKITIRIKAPESRSVSKKSPRSEFLPREEAPAGPTKITLKLKFKPQADVSKKCPRYTNPRVEDVTEQEEEIVKHEEEESSESRPLTPSVSSDVTDFVTHKTPSPFRSLEEWELAPAGSDDFWYPTPGRFGFSYDSDPDASSFTDYSSPFTTPATPSTPRTPGCDSHDEAYGMESMAWTDIDRIHEMLW
jgi:hypothetical protein